ncbi:type II secretion system F family protein [Pseudemcibacter aquimaris]|uniref:type II secretion system F family protein n=1 Tax=Pseudemcibacter aquimaris TaxID=2857064 RepID=UPI002011165E|nr:type II secretion system F family protein [Pseudemcibacter aquimaris]MCC3861438.1 type II secretion system F family protein [Pseudemcibacter aquimaris]WDU58207.1 type II secretion system F family protein [Pseudemcibacter aquimaris]
MIVDNPTLLMIAVFLGVLIIAGTVIVAMNIFGKTRKVTKSRLNKIKGRHGNAAIIEEQKKVLFKKQETSVLDGLIPKPEELRKRLRRTGRNITFKNYITANCIVAFVTLVLLFLFSTVSLVPSIAVSVAVGLFIPHLYVSMAINRRLNAFTVQFPEAIDLIVRGLKAGLPVTESIAAVAQEMEDPISTEFKIISDEVRFGKTLDEALWQTSERLETPEFKFFVICISVQQETGGNLSETLANLSSILRGRAQLKLKIKAMSSEGRASAGIIGALPFVMTGLMSIVNYEYISVMFTDPRGQVALLIGAVWMSIGIFIISKMINFET